MTQETKNNICESRQKDCDRRFQAIEKDLCVINKPEFGALANIKKDMIDKNSELHEKINRGLSYRPRWTVFWSIITVLASVTAGSYGYTYRVTESMSEKYDSRYEKLVTKEDFRDFKKEIIERFSQLEKKLEDRR